MCLLAITNKHTVNTMKILIVLSIRNDNFSGQEIIYVSNVSSTCSTMKVVTLMKYDLQDIML